jgi:hypothetical protein
MKSRRKYYIRGLVLLLSLTLLSGCDDGDSSNSSNNTNNSNNANNTNNTNCIPSLCSDFDSLECGVVDDGCGTTIDLVTDCSTAGCSGGDTCQGGGLANMCGHGCIVLACTDFPSLECGVVDDNCGGTIDLVTDCSSSGCSGADTCQGGGVANMCGQGCLALTCSDFPSHECGVVDDGCGGTIDMVTDCTLPGCTSPETCGGGGTPNICGEGCVIKSCADFPTAECGVLDDGCGGTIDIINDCGASGCTSPDVCGGTGNPAEAIYCGDSCPTRLTCDFQNNTYYECGIISDNCGGSLDLVADCGKTGCSSGESCTANNSGVLECSFIPCTSLTCSDFTNLECGLVNDGCGGVIDLENDCGSQGCSSPDICSGGGGGANICGDPTCSFPRKDCNDYDGIIANAITNGDPLCGTVDDGCGGTIDLVTDCGAPGCGTCTPGTPIDLQCVTMSAPTDNMDSKFCQENASGCPGEVIDVPVYLVVPTGCTLTHQRSLAVNVQGLTLLNPRNDQCGEENCIRREAYNDTVHWSQFTGNAIGCSEAQCPYVLPVGHVDTLQLLIPANKTSGDYTFSFVSAYVGNPCNECPDFSCDLYGTDTAVTATVRVY